MKMKTPMSQLKKKVKTTKGRLRKRDDLSMVRLILCSRQKRQWTRKLSKWVNHIANVRKPNKEDSRACE